MECYGNVSSMRHINGTLFDNTGLLIFLKLMPETKVTVATRLYMYSTPWPQDVSTNQIWNPYVK